MQIHIVSPGETLFSIARNYGVSPSLVEINNGLSDPSALVVGQALLLLFPQKTHLVGPGESLSSIARQYGVSLRTLYQNNLILNGQPTIWPGQTLVISYTDTPTRSIAVSGYAYPFISSTLLNQTLPFLSFLIPFTYGISSQGHLLRLNDEVLLAAARVQNVPAFLHLSSLTEEDTFSTERASMILNNPDLQSSLIEEILTVVQERGYQGVDVDFEFLPGTDAQAYADFIGALRQALSPLGLPVLVALAPKTERNKITQICLIYFIHIPHFPWLFQACCCSMIS